MQGYQLQPGQKFPIVRRVKDPSDSTVYYPQAVIRNAVTLVTLKTVDLVSQGGGFYSYEYEVPYDPSGQGMWIEITTTFFNDAGHTDNATQYVIESDTHLVLDRMNQSMGGGGGGADVDYKKIKSMVEGSAEKIVKAIGKPQKIEKPEKVDLSPITRRLDALPEVVASAIELPKPVELSSVMSEIKSVLKAVLDLPRYEPTDLSEVMDGLKKIQDSDANVRVDDLLKRIQQFFLTDMDTIKGQYNRIVGLIDTLPRAFKITSEAGKPEEPEEEVSPLRS